MQCPSCHAAIDGSRPFCSACGAPLPHKGPPDPLIGRMLAGKYKIVHLLGEGGMGAVYVGEQPLGRTTRRIAIKTMHPRLSNESQIRERFYREVGTLAGLEHPNTVQVFDFGMTEDGVLFIVMEFVQGRSVGNILEKGGPMPPARVEHIMKQICGSLEEAHDKGIIHRDLKPDNVILTERAGQKDFVKVFDFGIAKRSTEQDPNEAKLTQQGMVLGTPPYMSPEQFTGQPIDKRSDIYALGIMAYEMLTACLPFKANTAWEWASKHMTEMPTPLERQPLGAHVPPAMRAAIMRALAKNREDRFASVKEFIDAFTADSATKAPAVSVANAPSAFAPTAAMDAPPSNVGEPVSPLETGPEISADTPPPVQPSGMGGLDPASYPPASYSPRKNGMVIGLGALVVLLLGGGAIAAALWRKPPSPPPTDTRVSETPTASATATPPSAQDPQASVDVPPPEPGKIIQQPVVRPQTQTTVATTPASTPTPNVYQVPRPIPTPVPRPTPTPSSRKEPKVCMRARIERIRGKNVKKIEKFENACREQGGIP